MKLGAYFDTGHSNIREIDRGSLSSNCNIKLRPPVHLWARSTEEIGAAFVCLFFASAIENV